MGNKELKQESSLLLRMYGHLSSLQDGGGEILHHLTRLRKKKMYNSVKRVMPDIEEQRLCVAVSSLIFVLIYRGYVHMYLYKFIHIYT
jgi:hypothetical protein